MGTISCELFWPISNRYFMQSRKAERCTDIILKLACYCLSITVEDLNL